MSPVMPQRSTHPGSVLGTAKDERTPPTLTTKEAMWPTVDGIAVFRNAGPLDLSRPSVVARNAYTTPSSQNARALLHEYIASGELPFSTAFEISFSRQDHSTRVFKVVLSPGEAEAHGLPREMLLRVVAPLLEPFFRTEREVSTLLKLGEDTSLPVPRVFGHDSQGRNALGLEWMLTTADTGMPLDELLYNDGRRAVIWPAGRMRKTLCPNELKHILGQVETYLEELSKLEFDGVGGLYRNHATGEDRVGPLSDWAFSRDTVVPQAHQLVKASRTVNAQAGVGHSRIMHGNLHAGQILVNPFTLEVTCILDWSCAVIAPPEMLPGPLVLQEEI